MATKIAVKMILDGFVCFLGSRGPVGSAERCKLFPTERSAASAVGWLALAGGFNGRSVGGIHMLPVAVDADGSPAATAESSVPTAQPVDDGGNGSQAETAAEPETAGVGRGRKRR